MSSPVQGAPPACRGSLPRQHVDLQRACRRRAAAYKELLQRQQRQAKLGGLAQRMALQKQLMVRSPIESANIMSQCMAGCKGLGSPLVYLPGYVRVSPVNVQYALQQTDASE